MSAVRIFKPHNPLSKIIDPCDGAKAEYLIASARTRVAALDSEIRGYVARMLDKIAAYATVDDDSLFAARAAVGATALNIADVAGAIGMETIGEIARGLDAMVQSAAHGGVWRPDAVRLHIQSLGMVDQTRPDRTGEATILENLRALRLAAGAGE